MSPRTAYAAKTEQVSPSPSRLATSTRSWGTRRCARAENSARNRVGSKVASSDLPKAATHASRSARASGATALIVGGDRRMLSRAPLHARRLGRLSTSKARARTLDPFPVVVRPLGQLRHGLEERHGKGAAARIALRSADVGEERRVPVRRHMV